MVGLNYSRRNDLSYTEDLASRRYSTKRLITGGFSLVRYETKNAAMKLAGIPNAPDAIGSIPNQRSPKTPVILDTNG